ncbi:MAG TPA: hypothetical protein VMW20_09240 [Candidatus Nanoarchaeia archaeon]|nr:hypothetical protein [Candidatus Nanoarchaeia archaeon]
MVMQPIFYQMITAAFFILILMFITLMSIMGLFLIRKDKAVRRLYLLRPIFVELIKSKTGEVATTIKVPDLVGDPMEVKVPLYSIETIRRELVKNGEKKHLLWLSILVCTAYEDVLSFKYEILNNMKNDMKSLGLDKEAEDLTDICKFPISAFTFFKILTCIMESTIVRASNFNEIRKNADGYNIIRDVNTIRKFNIIIGYFKYSGLLILGLIISGVLLFYTGSIPEPMIWILLLIVIVIIGLIISGTFIIDKKLSKLLTCEDIEVEIKTNIPALKIRT